MMRKFNTKLLFKLVLLSALLISCSEKDKGLPGPDANIRGLNGIDAEVLSDVPIIEIDQPDAGEDACCGVPCQCGEEYEYQQRCWRSQLFFCTPDGLPPGGDPTLYQQSVTLDICNESGEPCEPEYANDESCLWQVIDMGECEDWLECDPTDPDVILQENVPCTEEDENGVVMDGFQDFICQKGQILAGPCNLCEEEICDSIDNDCDGAIDEGEYPCESECGVGTSVCTEGELTHCNAPLPTQEVCDNIDNNCNGLIDEELIRECETICEIGAEFCVEGSWTGCTAKAPAIEECNGIDDNCNGLIDENLQCACPPEMIGLLTPCMEEPLVCGQGFKTCECQDELCSETQMTECFAMCHWLPMVGEECDSTLGVPIPEICNNFDDDCDLATDEGLLAECYSGPVESINIGACIPGELVCSGGKWGNFNEDVFIEDMCLGEITPLEEDLCTGQDDNCDGIIENIMEETDILFIVDTSGSMSSTINAVQNAMSMFSAHYADQEVVQWGLAVGPIEGSFNEEELILLTNLTSFDQFLPALVAVDDDDTGSEMLYDALFLSLKNLLPLGSPLLMPQNWPIQGDFSSTPGPNNWNISWRDDANRVIIIFSDEEGQSYLNPEVSQQMIQDAASQVQDLSIYSFSSPGSRLGPDGWEPVSIGGGWFPLTSNAITMFDNLMQILDETACNGED